MRVAVIDGTGLVQNVIVIGDLSFNPGEGLSIVPSDTANIGDVYQDGSFAPPAPTLEQAKIAKRVDLAEQLASKFEIGFTVPAGAMQGAVLQTRSLEDRTNWLTSQASYSTMVAMGRGNEAGANFRDSSNVTHTVTFSEGLSVLLAMAKWGADVMGRSWALKDQIIAAATLAELDAIDIGAGWP